MNNMIETKQLTKRFKHRGGLNLELSKINTTEKILWMVPKSSVQKEPCFYLNKCAEIK